VFIYRINFLYFVVCFQSPRSLDVRPFVANSKLTKQAVVCIIVVERHRHRFSCTTEEF